MFVAMILVNCFHFLLYVKEKLNRVNDNKIFQLKLYLTHDTALCVSYVVFHTMNSIFHCECDYSKCSLPRADAVGEDGQELLDSQFSCE